LQNNRYKQYLIEQAANELAAQNVKQHMIERIAPVLIDDLLNNTCSSCNGTGVNKYSKTCGSCQGTGRKGYTYKKLQTLLGVSNGTLSRKYIHSYRATLQRFEFLCGAAEKTVRAKLGK
jgi:RecJ-like exonuclease